MAFCPRCGREQRCGCEECHLCGVGLVERLPDAGRPAAERETGPRERHAATPPGETAHTVRSGQPGASHERRGAGGTLREVVGGLLPTLMVVLGAAVLAITLIEMARTANGFFSQGLGLSPGLLRRLGYYMGSVSYSGSVRLLSGFSLVIIGMLIDPPRPFGGRESWRRGMLVTGGLAGLASLASLAAVVLVVIPGGGTASLAASGSLPSLGWSVPVLLVLGLSLMWASYLVTVRAVDVARGEARDAASGTARGGAGGDDRDPGLAARGLDGTGKKAAPAKSFFARRARR